MGFGALFSRPSAELVIAQRRPEKAFDAETALYVAGLIANLINRAAATGGFRGAIGAHPHMTRLTSSLRSDTGERAEYGLTVNGWAGRASINVAGVDAGRLAFLGFAPIHKSERGCDPCWTFASPDDAIETRATIIGVTLGVSCTNNPDRSATITLTL
jgi:hypothetical protein